MESTDCIRTSQSTNNLINETGDLSISSDQNDKVDKAVIFLLLNSTDAENSTIPKELQDIKEEYFTLLRERGFEVSPVIENSGTVVSVTDIKTSLKNAIEGSRNFVAVIIRESNDGTELDQVLSSLPEDTNGGDRVIVFCRIGKSSKKPGFFDDEAADGRKKLGNSAVISAAVKTRAVATDFFKILKDLIKTCWSNGLDEIDERFNSKQCQSYGMHTYFPKDKKMTRHFVCQSEYLLHNYKFSELVQDESKFNVLDETVVQRLRKERENEDQWDLIYKSDGINKRKALIINNVNFHSKALLGRRDGSEYDVGNLKHCLGLLQYEVTTLTDLEAGRIKSEVQGFANSPDHGDSCILVVMSHGEDGIICGTDYVKDNPPKGFVKDKELLDMMRKGEGVKTKPRLVLFQACRNKSSTNEGTDSKTENMDSAPFNLGQFYYQEEFMSELQPPPDQCGMIVGYSTSQGESAYRSLCKGTRFILSVCVAFYQFASKEDMVSMVTRINHIMTKEFQKPIQLPYWTVQTDKKFFLVDTSAIFATEDNQQVDINHTGHSPQDVRGDTPTKTGDK